MLNQPMKLLLVAGVVAVLGASFLSQNFDTSVDARPVAPTSAGSEPGMVAANKPVTRSWYGGWFEGMSFRRDPVPPPRPQPAPVSRPQQSRATGVGSVMIAADRGGQYHSSVDIDGQQIPMLVDTGATVVALRHEDAQKLGIMPMPSDYTVKISTANGEIHAARTTLRDVRVENIAVQNVSAVVMPEGALHKSLLGMSFLRRLKRFEVASGNLVLQP
ncbi:MAG: TIGR02281 family clan AA aspartic protease [Hyphomicrobiales bacterium]|nr:TIGR02281 family clan AA aspartic protease [Hyphomicrobiales bacterium]